jgi:hypothetical protein
MLGADFGQQLQAMFDRDLALSDAIELAAWERRSPALHLQEWCIVALVGSWYSNPEATSVASIQDVPLSYRYILQQFSTRGPLR